MDDSEGEQLPSGLVRDQAAAYAASFAKSLSVDNERWAKAELRTAEIIDRIQPTRASEERRKAVAEFVRNLICKCFGESFPQSSCKVFTFGSFPLLTYLPHGDIDLTIVSQDPSLKDTWANVLRSTLERAERNQDSEFKVKNVQYIHAEVKLIKCVVGNITVDISFNQLGGLCTLCFLDEVDSIIGQNHFFKRSIILVKAWCYYESAILGAHHGVISTYALETLVLYIFHVFHNSIRGPLEVLFRFLEFFSKFDWHKYCVSLWGPVAISSLPDMTGESPRKDGRDLLLSQEFLKECCQAYAVFPGGQDNQQRSFNAKYLNIVDPLRPGNNLGRSVSETHFKRIVGTFGKNGKKGTFGKSAEELLNTLHDSSIDIVEQLEDRRRGFFKRINRTLDALEEDGRPDAPDFIARAIPSSGVSNHQNGYGPTTLKYQENGDSILSYGAETYYVDQRFQNKPSGWVSEVDARTQTSTRVAQMVGNQAHIASSAFSYGGGDTNYGKTALSGTPLDNGLPIALSNGSTSAIELSHSNHAGGRGTLPKIEKSKGHRRRASLDLSNGDATESGVNGSRQWGDARDLASVDSHSSEQGDVKLSVEEYPTKNAIPAGNRGKHPGSNSASKHASSTATSQATGPECVRGDGHFAAEDSPEGSTPSRSSADSSSDKEASRRGAWAGEPTVYRETAGIDTRGHTQQSIPLTLPLIPPSFVKIPSLTLSRPGQLPMHLATPMHSVHPSPVLGDSSLRMGHRAGAYYGMQLPRGPPAPPLPPSYFHGPPFILSAGENANPVNSRMSAYPAQHVDEKFMEQQQREIWQQVEQLQIHDHQQQYGVQRAATTVSPSASSVSQHIDSDSVNTLISSQTPAGLESASKSGSSNHAELSSDANSAQGVSDDAPVEENGTSWQEDGDTGNSTFTRGKFAHSVPEERGKGNKISKSSREKRGQLKHKSSSNDESVESVKSVDVSPTPSSTSESVVRWPSQGSADDSVPMTQGYPQLVHPPASVVYPNLLPSSLAISGNGSMSAEMSPYPPPPLLPSHRTPGAHSPIPTQSQPQSSSTSVMYPVGTTSSFRPPVTELVSGSVSTQRPRQMETASVHPPPFYQQGNPFFLFPYYSMGVDFLSGFHFSPSVDNFSESSAAQAAESLRSKFVQQMGAGVGEKLKAAGIPTRARFRMEQTAPDNRPVDASELKDAGFDLLNSDFHEHLQNLDVARMYQRSPVQARQHPSYPTPSAQYYPNYRPWEGPGRPLAQNMNILTNVMSHGHGVVQGPPSLNTSGRMVGNYPRTYTGPVSYGREEQPKPHGGTGTYLPTPRPVFYRDRQSSGSNRQHGGYGQDRNERSDREGHQGHTQYRTRNVGRGQNKYDLRSQSNNMGGVDRNNVDVKGGERGRDGQRLQDGLRRNPVQSAPSTTFSSSSPGQSTVTGLPATSVGIPAGMNFVPVMTSNGNSPSPGMAGASIPPVVMVYPSENRVGPATEPLEFGSLGPVQGGTTQGGNDADAGGAHTPTPSGSALASGDRSSHGPSSPKQRVMQRTYQLKEEDFPPLSFPGQHGSSSTGYDSGSSASSQVSPFPAYVATPSS